MTRTPHSLPHVPCNLLPSPQALFLPRPQTRNQNRSGLSFRITRSSFHHPFPSPLPCLSVQSNGAQISHAGQKPISKCKVHLNLDIGATAGPWRTLNLSTQTSSLKTPDFILQYQIVTFTRNRLQTESRPLVQTTQCFAFSWDHMDLRADEASTALLHCSKLPAWTPTCIKHLQLPFKIH